MCTYGVVGQVQPGVPVPVVWYARYSQVYHWCGRPGVPTYGVVGQVKPGGSPQVEPDQPAGEESVKEGGLTGQVDPRTRHQHGPPPRHPA